MFWKLLSIKQYPGYRASQPQIQDSAPAQSEHPPQFIAQREGHVPLAILHTHLWKQDTSLVGTSHATRHRHYYKLRWVWLQWFWPSPFSCPVTCQKLFLTTAISFTVVIKTSLATFIFYRGWTVPKSCHSQILNDLQCALHLTNYIPRYQVHTCSLFLATYVCLREITSEYA